MSSTLDVEVHKVEYGTQRNFRITDTTFAAGVIPKQHVWLIGCSFDPSGDYSNIPISFDKLSKTAPVDEVAISVFREALQERADANLMFDAPKVEMNIDDSIVTSYSGAFDGEGDWHGYGVVVEGQKYLIAHPANTALNFDCSPEDYRKRHGYPPAMINDAGFINALNAFLHALFIGTKKYLKQQAIEKSQFVVSKITESTPIQNNELNSELVGLGEKIDEIRDLIENNKETKEDLVEAGYSLKRFLQKFGDAVAEQLGAKFADALCCLGSLLLWLIAMM